MVVILPWHTPKRVCSKARLNDSRCSFSCNSVRTREAPDRLLFCTVFDSRLTRRLLVVLDACEHGDGVHGVMCVPEVEAPNDHIRKINVSVVPVHCSICAEASRNACRHLMRDKRSAKRRSHPSMACLNAPELGSGPAIFPRRKPRADSARMRADGTLGARACGHDAGARRRLRRSPPSAGLRHRRNLCNRIQERLPQARPPPLGVPALPARPSPDGPRRPRSCGRAARVRLGDMRSGGRIRRGLHTGPLRQHRQTWSCLARSLTRGDRCAGPTSWPAMRPPSLRRPTA